jgi:cold shock protein
LNGVFRFPNATTYRRGCTGQTFGGTQMDKTSGVVKWFSRLKGYGFINPDDGSQEVFVHYSAIEGDGYRNLYEGDRVEFVLIDQGKGPQAQHVLPKRSYNAFQQ